MKPFGIDSINESERKEVARRALNNLLTSYADEADIFTEIVQNAVDAIKMAADQKLFSSHPPELTIVIGRRATGHHYFFVKDNGTGMSKDVAHNLTVPGYSFGKKRGKTIGYKGVGASYFFAASQMASIQTVDIKDNKTAYTIKNSYNWIKNDEENEPTIEDHAQVPNFLKDLLPDSRGTAIYFQFHDGMKPKNLNNLVIIGDGPDRELQNWASFLTIKTALGISEPNDLLKDLKINLHLDHGDSQYFQTWKYGNFDLDERSLGYPYPHKVFKVGVDKSTLDNLEPQHRYRHIRKNQAVYYRWGAEEIIDLTQTLEENEKEVLRQYLKWAEGYLCYSVDVFKEINKRLGGRSNLLRYGMRIVCDNTPQGRIIDLSLTSSQGLDRQSHVILSFENLELDTGRKISADESIANAINKLGQRIIAILKEYRWAMKKKERPDPSSDLEAWRNSVDSRSQTSLVSDFYEKFSLYPVFKVDPDTEQEVIALFTSILSNSLLKGYQLLAISGFNRYDALIDITSDFTGSRELTDIISKRSDDYKIDGKGKVLEFKHNFDDLLFDFEEKTKNPSEIDLVVCWNVPNLNVSRGRIDPMYGKWKDHRIGYGISYMWYDENDTSTIPIISLKNLLSEILSKKESECGETGLGYSLLRQMETQDAAHLI
ncbi:ATP-binding protein [Chitinophaga sp. LS1]|uniref:ATP-binding protein n=1 Tax=Chitinophaga sp. LS1 TaxID=3051176 RepID=UPI002AAB8B5F|nr:ATP-binding protein [Chitinophaga sp. LS1]WPV65924.1 ATP-binding protein [Chitinophaga sp. LS1]